MPFLAFFGYILLEVMVFWAMVNWVGFGWAFLIMVLLMVVGSIVAGSQLRSVAASGQHPNANPGRTAGTLGLIMIAAVLASIPGYLTSVISFILLFGPTRELIRRMLAASLTKKMENFGLRMYSNSPMAAQRDFYGSFSDPEVIDEEEIRRWSNNARPEEFRKDDN